MLKIAIIIGSTRPGRNGEAVAKWVHGIAQTRNEGEFELVDLKDFNLPLLDEPASSMGHTVNLTPKSGPPKKVESSTALFTSPRSTTTASPGRSRMPSIFSFASWNNKAAGFVSYGGIGGARAVEQLRLVYRPRCKSPRCATKSCFLYLPTLKTSASSSRTPDTRSQSMQCSTRSAWSGALKTLRGTEARSLFSTQTRTGAARRELRAASDQASAWMRWRTRKWAD